MGNVSSIYHNHTWMKPRIHIFFLFGLLLLLGSCGKDYDQFLPNRMMADTSWRQPTALNADLQKLFADIANTPLVAEVPNIESGDTVLFPGPIALVIPERSCQGAGSAPASGAVRIELTLLRTKGEFIRNSKPTGFGQNPVHTSAIANVRILQNGQELQLKSGATVLISYADSYPLGNLNIFYADAPATDRPYIDWTYTTDGSYATAFTRPNPGAIGQYITGYDLRLKALRWVNCGKVADTTRPDRISVTLPLTFTNANTALFIVLRDSPSVIQMDADPHHEYFHTSRVPDGQKVMAVSISYINGDYFVGSTEALSADGLNIGVKPQKKTLGELLEFLAGI
jgi:hypothetical protein